MSLPELDVYVLYGADEVVAAERVRRLLQVKGLSVYTPDSPVAGLDPALARRRALRVLVLLSQGFLNDPEAQRDLAEALDDDRLNRSGRIVLLRIDDCEPVGVLSQYAWREVGPLRELSDVRLAEILERAAAGSVSSPDAQHLDHYDVFISRAGKESTLSQRFARCLQAAGLKVYQQNWHMEDRNFMDRIDFGVQHSDRVLALLSHHYIASDYCRMEWSQVTKGEPLHESRRLIALWVDDCEPAGLIATAPRWDLRHLIGIIDDDELTELLVEAASGAVSPFEANLQYVENPPVIQNDWAGRATSNFTGRAGELERLHDVLAPDDAPLFTDPVVIHGMSGSGKSTLAREYARRNLHSYAGIWWFNAELDLIDHREEPEGTDGGATSTDAEGTEAAATSTTEEEDAEGAAIFTDVERGFAELGRTHFFGRSLHEDVHEAARRVYEFLRRACRAELPSKPWLLVFDNADHEALTAWLGWNDTHAQVILTTQVEAVCNLGEHVIDLTEWTEEDAHRYLADSCPRRKLTTSDLRRLTDALGLLPLPLAQAAATLRQTPLLTVPTYVGRLLEMMKQVPEGSDYGKAVYATFREAIDKAEHRTPGARAVMSLLACLGADGIPLAVFEAPAPCYPDVLRPVIEGDRAIEVASRLVNLALVTPSHMEDPADVEDDGLDDDPQDKITLSVHQLVRSVAQDLLGEDLVTWRRHAVEVVGAAFPRLEPDDFAVYLTTREDLERAAALEPHVDDVLAGTVGEVVPARAALLVDAAVYLTATGRTRLAAPLIREGLDGWERVGLHDDVDLTARALLASAWISRRSSKMDDARDAAERAVELLEQDPASRPSALAAALTELGALHWHHEDHDDAITVLTRAKDLLAQKGQQRSPAFGAACNYLGQVYYDEGRFEESLEEHELDASICAETFPADHPRRLVPLHNAAWARLELDDVERAHADFLFDLEASGRLLGPEHPQTALSHEGVGEAASRLAVEKADPEERAEWFATAAHHLNRAVSLLELESDSSMDLGDALQALADHEARSGDLDGARRTFERAAAMFLETGKQDSPRREYCLERLRELEAAPG